MYKKILILICIVLCTNSVADAQKQDSLFRYGGHEIGYIFVEHPVLYDTIFSDIESPCHFYVLIRLTVETDSTGADGYIYGEILDTHFDYLVVDWEENKRETFFIEKYDGSIKFTTSDNHKYKRLLKREKDIWNEVFEKMYSIVKKLFINKKFKSANEPKVQDNGEKYLYINEYPFGIVCPNREKNVISQ